MDLSMEIEIVAVYLVCSGSCDFCRHVSSQNLASLHAVLGNYVVGVSIRLGDQTVS